MALIAGTGIELQDVMLAGLIVFAAILFGQLALHWNDNVLNTLAYDVLGYPVCQSTLCILPDQASLSNAGALFTSTFWVHFSLTGFITNIVGVFNSIKGIVGGLIVIIAFGWFSTAREPLNHPVRY